MKAERTRETRRLSLRAHAKLNVSLRVLAREESGYHSIETIFLRLELADHVALEATTEPGIRLEVEGDPAVPSDASNLCWRAADAALRELDPRGGVRIHLCKSVPSGAGLGGGSSDAAAVLTGMNRLWGSPLDDRQLVRLAGSIGSDVPFGLCDSSMAFAWERGRRLLPLSAPPPWPALVVVPGYRVGAGEAYGWLAEDRKIGLGAAPGPCRLPDPIDLSKPAVLAGLATNDLEGPVFRRHPELAGIRDRLAESGADLAMLCGSGSCVAGLFADESGVRAAEESLEGEVGITTIRTRTLA